MEFCLYCSFLDAYQDSLEFWNQNLLFSIQKEVICVHLCDMRRNVVWKIFTRYAIGPKPIWSRNWIFRGRSNYWPALRISRFFDCFPSICVFVENIIVLMGFTLVSIRNSIKLVYSERATKFWDLSYVVPVKITVEILQTFVAFWEYVNFTNFWKWPC